MPLALCGQKETSRNCLQNSTVEELAEWVKVQVEQGISIAKPQRKQLEKLGVPLPDVAVLNRTKWTRWTTAAQEAFYSKMREKWNEVFAELVEFRKRNPG